MQRQAFAGMLWCKQFYQYVVRDWLNGDPLQPPPPASGSTAAITTWQHVYSDDILSMPDNWEYPWFAAWDLAFHVHRVGRDRPGVRQAAAAAADARVVHAPERPGARLRVGFRDVNPPVHAWAALRVYQIERKMTGVRRRVFLERVFQKLLLNFTWWVNRKDAEGNNVFQGGFLGLDNIGVFDRSAHAADRRHDSISRTARRGWACTR